MTKEEYLVKEVVGTGKSGRLDSRIFAYAIYLARVMMFQQGIAMEDILITKTIYPEAGKQYGIKPKTAARAIERLSNRCWDRMTEEQRVACLGESCGHPSPREIVLLLGWYCEHGKSYREAAREQHADFFLKQQK